jgi:hypothetical protein
VATSIKSVFEFPNPVNETSARIVASGAVAMALGVVLLGQMWLLIPLAYGFVARVLTGPTLSPLGQIATRLITPRINRDHRFVAGAPKRFAQGIGAVLSVIALVAHFGFGATAAAYILIAMLAVAAFAEAAFAYCLGCVIFARLMRIGLIPASICAECNNITERLASQISSRSA